jgi:hypothetical protein
VSPKQTPYASDLKSKSFLISTVVTISLKSSLFKYRGILPGHQKINFCLLIQGVHFMMLPKLRTTVGLLTFRNISTAS